MLNLESSQEGYVPEAQSLPASILKVPNLLNEEISTLEKSATYIGEEGDLDQPLASELRYSYYIQATRIEHRAFLTTNLPTMGETQVTDVGSTWLIGRSRNCAIVVPDRSISRCHAVISHDPQYGFYVMDVGSSNGTFLNQQRLAVLKRYPIKDGDIVTLCHLRTEFFMNPR